MDTEFQTTLKRLLAQSGKSVTMVATHSGVDRAYIMRLLSGEKRHPSVETLFRLWMGLALDPRVVREYPTFQHGLSELLVTSAMSNAPLKLTEVG